jgi:hypothetical protein
MRLINCETLELEQFFGSDIPRYAILSHTWGNDEVTFADLPLHQASTTTKSGYRKIRHTCEQALQDGLHYAWVDTCCIDKTSSAELSEAINSMYAWYGDSNVCYAILEDICKDNFPADFGTSRWFTRGWTLQELIAPDVVFFYDQNWVQLGTRQDFASLISSITSIDREVLFHGVGRRRMLRLDQFSVAKRMSWASLRETTREEDIAYCLLGIFELNMPLLYGEGAQAFVRLQEELMRRTDDDSILACDLNDEVEIFPLVTRDSYTRESPCDFLATSPKSFRHCGDLVRTIGSTVSFSKSNIGLHIRLPILPVEIRTRFVTEPRFIGLLSCVRSVTDDRKRGQMLGILLFPLDPPNSSVVNTRMTRRTYYHQGVKWRTATVDVEDLIHSSVKAITIINKQPQLPDVPGKNQHGKNECFIIYTPDTLVARGYHFTHAKSWFNQGRMRSTSSEDLRLQPGKCTFANYDFQGTVLFMTFEHVSGPQNGDFTVCIDLCSGHTGVLDVPLRHIDDSYSLDYSWLKTKGPRVSFYKPPQPDTPDKSGTHYSSNRFNITAKLLKEVVVHKWRICEINIEFHGDRSMDNPQSLPKPDLVEPISQLQNDPRAPHDPHLEESNQHPTGN